MLSGPKVDAANKHSQKEERQSGSTDGCVYSKGVGGSSTCSPRKTSEETDRSTSLGPGAGLDARDGPRRGGHSILLCVTKKSRGSRGDLFFHCVMIHRQFLLGFISGASLLLRSWSSDALLKQGIELPCHSLRGAGHDSVVLLIGPGASNESASSWFHCCLSLSFWRDP